ncbi:MAG: chorismate mutase [Candidatus Izemoplasma sp.]
MDKINTLRKEIDTIDEQLMNLLDKRYNLTNQIGILKTKTEKVIEDVDRESKILNKISKYGHSPSIELVYKAIINESKNKQRK